MTPRILRRPQVEASTGLSRSTLYAMMAEGEFPQPVRLGKRAVGWSEAAIAPYSLGRRPSASRSDRRQPQLVPEARLARPHRPPERRWARHQRDHGRDRDVEDDGLALAGAVHAGGLQNDAGRHRRGNGVEQGVGSISPEAGKLTLKFRTRNIGNGR
jgi:prophage regulatory protein